MLRSSEAKAIVNNIIPNQRYRITFNHDIINIIVGHGGFLQLYFPDKEKADKTYASMKEYLEASQKKEIKDAGADVRPNLDLAGFTHRFRLSLDQYKTLVQKNVITNEVAIPFENDPLKSVVINLCGVDFPVKTRAGNKGWLQIHFQGQKEDSAQVVNFIKCLRSKTNSKIFTQLLLNPIGTIIRINPQACSNFMTIKDELPKEVNLKPTRDFIDSKVEAAQLNNPHFSCIETFGQNVIKGWGTMFFMKALNLSRDAAQIQIEARRNKGSQVNANNELKAVVSYEPDSSNYDDNDFANDSLSAGFVVSNTGSGYGAIPADEPGVGAGAGARSVHSSLNERSPLLINTTRR